MSLSGLVPGYPATEYVYVMGINKRKTSKAIVIFIFANFVQISGKTCAIHKLRWHHKCTSTSIYKGCNTNSSLEGN